MIIFFYSIYLQSGGLGRNRGIFFIYVIFSSCIFCLTTALFKHSSIILNTPFQQCVLRVLLQKLQKSFYAQMICSEASFSQWDMEELCDSSQKHTLQKVQQTNILCTFYHKFGLTQHKCFGADTKSMLVGTWSRICLTTYYKTEMKFPFCGSFCSTVYIFILLFWTSKLQPLQS